MARVKSRSSFFPCSETKQKSLLRRLMRHEIHNYLFFFGRWAVLALKLWPSVSITVITWWLFFIGLPVRATLNQEIPLVHVEKRPNGRNGISRKLLMSLFPWGRFLRGGDASFQVVHDLANRLGSRFGTNTKLFCGVFGPISAPNYYLNTVFDGEISLRGSCRNNALPRFPREKL